MDKIKNSKQFDLDERTFIFARRCREFVKSLPKMVADIEDGKQLIRSSGSVRANYLEASESLSKKDFYLRIKICRKEAKESKYWLRLIDTGRNDGLEKECYELIQEATELMRIFGSIVSKQDDK